MKKNIVCILSGLLALSAVALAQAPQNPPPAPGQPGGGPAYATDITKAEVDMVNKNDPTTDRQLRVVDLGKYNLGVGIIHRGPGDIIIIPAGVGHGWSQITDHVDYLSVRPDPEKVLPAGWVYPLLLKTHPEEVKQSK